MPIPFLNQTTGQLESYREEDLTPENLTLLQARGLRQATPEDIANRERTIEYSSVGQQALAQAERVVRGASLGQIEGFGSDEENRARAEVSQEVSPVLSMAADFAPDIALGALTAGGASLLTSAGRVAGRAALTEGLGAALGAATKAAPIAALAGEAAAGGLVTASQQAFQEGRTFFHENPVEDATNALLWAGIGGVLGGAPMAFKAIRGAGKAGKTAAEVADEAELAAARAAGEAEAIPVPASAGESSTGVPLTSDQGTLDAHAAASGMESRPIAGMSEEGHAALERSRARQAAGGYAHITAGPAKTTEDVSERAWVYSGKRAQQGLDDETREALRVYTESGHQGVNKLLRGDSARSVDNDDYFRGMADKVDGYLAAQAEAGNATPGVVYRGVKDGVLPDKLRPGEIWGDSGILSTTRDIREAQNFGGGAVIEIEQSSGIPIFRKQWRNINTEQEVLLRAGSKFEVVSDKMKRLPNRQMRRVVRVREIPRAKPGEFSVPLDDVQTLDKEGYLEPAPPRKLKKYQGEIQSAADTAISGKSLDDLRALPIEGEGAAESRKKIDSFKADQGFRETGMLPSNNDRGRGGLPAFGIEADGSVYLVNGRHRLTAAQESGQEFIVANLKKYNKKGDTVWDYVGPVRVNRPRPGSGVALARSRARQGQGGAVMIGDRLMSSPERPLLRNKLVESDAGEAIFGDLGEDEIEGLFGVGRFTHDAEPDVRQVFYIPKSGYSEVEVTFPGENGGIDLQTRYISDPKATDALDKQVVKLDRVFQPDADKGKGLLKRYFRDVLPIWKRMGIGTIQIPELAVDGVVVWPQLGFRPDPWVESQVLAAASEAGLPSESLRALSKTDGGRALLRKTYESQPGWFRSWRASPADIAEAIGPGDIRPRGAERGMVNLGELGGRAWGATKAIAGGPMGNVIGAGAGGYAGGQVSGNQQGMLAGGALGLAASLLAGRRGASFARRLGTDAAEKVAAREGKAVLTAEKGVARAERNAIRSQADDIVRKAVKGEGPLSRVDGFLRDSRLAQYQPEIIETATKEMRNDLNELNTLSQGIRERAVKQEDVAKNIADNLPAQQAKAREIALAGQRLAGSIMADARALGEQMGKRPQYFSGTARDLVSSLVERTKAIAQMKDGAEIFNALDDLKRVADNHKVALEAGSRKSAKDPLRYQALIPRVEEFANTVRATLEDVPTFGRAGEMQKAYNATYHQKWFPAKQVFEDSVFRRTGRDYKAFDVMDAWESKVTGLLENAGSGERRHVTDMLGALKEMAEQRAKYGTAPKAETDRIVSLVDKIERTFKLADDTTAAKGRMETLMPVAQGVGHGVGAAMGGLPGAILGGSVVRGAAELATGKYRRAFMAMRGATEETVERSVDDWIKVSKGRASPGISRMRMPKLELPPEAAYVMQRAKRMGVTFGMAQFLEDNKDPQSAFTMKRDALLDDEGFVQRFADEFGDLATEEPQVYAVAAGKAGEVRKFLLDRLPTSVAVSMARPNGYPPTNEAIEDWSVYWNASTNPRSVVESLSRGDIRPQEVETLRTLYRPLYEKLQATLLDKISRASELGDDLDDQFVMRMSLLFDLDGAGTPAFSQRAANVARQVAPAQPPQQSKPFAPKAGSRVSPSNVGITGPTYGTMPG